MSATEDPRNSSVPLLKENNSTEDSKGESGLLAKGKRKLLSLGKKKEDEKTGVDTAAEKRTTDMAPPPVPALSADRSAVSSGPPRTPVSPLQSPPVDQRLSPRGSPRMNPTAAVSPTRRLRSSSPGLSSPASSQIFERNVQENTLSGELSPAIPGHIQTEDHIPPVLEASSLAITDDHLNPDEVEIVTHSAHQPASATISGDAADSVYSPTLEDSAITGQSFPAGLQDTAEDAPTYGSLDTTDVRRLSFISFADVVQAEHAETNRDTAAQFMSLSSTANRSPSPVLSPAPSHGLGASPPNSGATSLKGAELASPMGLRSPSSPTTATGTHSPPLGGDLNIETMRQALRKTGSGDLSHARSQHALSATSLEDNTADQAPFE